MLKSRGFVFISVNFITLVVFILITSLLKILVTEHKIVNNYSQLLKSKNYLIDRALKINNKDYNAVKCDIYFDDLYTSNKSFFNSCQAEIKDRNNKVIIHYITRSL